MRCQGEDGADHSNPGSLLLDGEWEITRTQLALGPAHELKLRQASPGMVHTEESLTLGCRPDEAKVEQVSTVHHGARNPCLFFFQHRPPPKAPGRSHHLMSYSLILLLPPPRQLQQYCHTSGAGLLREQRSKDHHKTSQVNTQSS